MGGALRTWIVPPILVIGLALVEQSAAADLAPVAAMEQVERSVYGAPPQSPEVVKRRGDAVVFAETLQTLNDSRALVRFIDGSALNMGAQSKVLVDEFVFDPQQVKGSALLKISVGTLRFVTGAMPKGGVVIKTPTATLTLRGTDVTVHVHPNGTTDVAVHDGLVDNHNDFTGEQVTLSPGDAETTTEAGNQDFTGDLGEYGLNTDINDSDSATAVAVTSSPASSPSPSGGGGKSHGKSGEKGGGKGNGKGKN
jgi:hypothetical protein